MFGLVVVVRSSSRWRLRLCLRPPTRCSSTPGLTSGKSAAADTHFLLGTDALGRDELSRLLYGARISFAVGIGANPLAAVIGIVLGGVAGLSRGWVETLLMRLVDVTLSFPILLLAIVFLAVTPPNLFTLLLIIGISFGAYLARVVFAQVSSLREREFVLAARTGALERPRSWSATSFRTYSRRSSCSRRLESRPRFSSRPALSYVGVGIKPPTPSWGNMISEGQQYLFTTPWLVAFPSGAVVLAMVGFSLLGDGLRDALDPTLERRARLVIRMH